MYNTCFQFTGSHLLEVSVHGCQRYYVATNWDGTSIGRFGNKKGILKALADVKNEIGQKSFTIFLQT